MAEYPDTKKIRARLEMCKVPDSFVDAAYNVCDEVRPGATLNPDSTMDLQLIAKLQFIERVLDGEDRR